MVNNYIRAVFQDIIIPLFQYFERALESYCPYVSFICNYICHSIEAKTKIAFFSLKRVEICA